MGVIHIQPRVSFLIFLIAYSREILNSSGDKAFPCFELFSMGKLEDKKFPILTISEFHLNVSQLIKSTLLGICSDVFTIDFVKFSQSSNYPVVLKFIDEPPSRSNTNSMIFGIRWFNAVLTWSPVIHILSRTNPFPGI